MPSSGNDVVLVVSLRSGTEVLINAHCAQRYQERVMPDASPSVALAALKENVEDAGRIAGRPAWVPESQKRRRSRWVVLHKGDVALLLIGRVAVSCFTKTQAKG
jgi:hypothetical protein